MKYSYISLFLLFVLSGCIETLTLTDLQTRERIRVFHKRPSKHHQGDTIVVRDGYGKAYYRIENIK